MLSEFHQIALSLIKINLSYYIGIVGILYSSCIKHNQLGFLLPITLKNCVESGREFSFAWVAVDRIHESQARHNRQECVSCNSYHVNT